MHFSKSDIEDYLAEVRKAIAEDRYQIAPRPKNKKLMTDFIIYEKDEIDIINSLTAMDFSEAEPNDHKGREYEIIYKFGKDVKLKERYGSAERVVSLYIKFNKTDNCYLFVISFHEQERPLSYYFR